LQQVYGIASQDLSGSVTAFAPKWSGSLTGSYTETLPDDYQFTGEVTAYYTDSYYMDGSDDSTVRQTAFTRVDARLTLLWPDGRWALDVLGKNLTDRTVYSFSQAMPLSLGSVAVEREEPRNFAFQVRYQW
jgi:outer membrane receptor protein involved in Fe transport